MTVHEITVFTAFSLVCNIVFVILLIKSERRVVDLITQNNTLHNALTRAQDSLISITNKKYH